VRPVFPPFDYNDPAVLLARLRDALPELHRAALELVLAAAPEVFLVGGIVRDLLLSRANADLDFVTLEYAPGVVRRLLPRFEGYFPAYKVKMVEHSAFGTARLDLGDSLHLDFATARHEIYSHPAALPTVSFPATLLADLKRRDFTINALALSPAQGLLDPFNGLSDLREGWLRVLHPDSFVDDPTRLVRGVRFAARLGYGFDPQTAQLFETANARNYFELLTPERKRNELRQVLKELRPVKGLALLQAYGLLGHIHPALTWNEGLDRAFNRLESVITRPQPYEYLAALLHLQGEANAAAILKGLNFAGLEAQIPREVARLWEEVRPDLRPSLKNSRLDSLLKPYKPESLRLFEALLPLEEQREPVRRYREEVRGRSPQLTGDYLLQMGVPPGPEIRGLLGALRAAVLDGEVVGPAAEAAFLAKLLGRTA
jgi:tRNA nucleotidyltransferase (CCA-adding enzyme)